MRFLGLAAFAVCIAYSQAVICWKCDNAIDNDACVANGRKVSCRGNQHGCQTEQRYHLGLIPHQSTSKRCKQGLACDNNVGQNAHGNKQRPQCNPHIPESICRCCCETDMCNFPEMGCLPEYPTCRQLNEIENGEMRCKFGTPPPSIGEQCTFQCDDGFELVGEPVLNCDFIRAEKADWDFKEPTCKPKKCMPNYNNLENGFVTCTNRNLVGSVCTHECDIGYTSEGPLVATCMPSENWDYPQPKCIPITCPPEHTNLDFGSVDCTNYNFLGSSCSFTCDDGYTLQGSSILDCLDDFNGDQFGPWSDAPPKCVPLVCQPQSRHPTDGRVACTDANRGGSICSYSCDPGFAVEGPPSRECIDDGDGDAIGMWTDDEPICAPIRCIPDYSKLRPTKGSVSCDNQNFVDSVCDFDCEPGYKRVGSALSICEDDGDGDAIGRWTDPPPSCASGPCEPELVDPPNGKVVCTDRNNMRSICTFTCDRGYYMATEAGKAVPSRRYDLICTMDSVWNKVPPQCLPITCNPPHRETDILAVDCTNDNNYQSNCKFSCKDGSRPDGPQESICNDDGNGDADGVWVPPLPPTCRPQFCQPPQVHPQNGRVSCSNRNMHGSICSYTCNPGFYLINPGRKPVGDTVYDVECKGTKWDKQPPSCGPIKCVPPHVDPENGGVRCSKQNNYRSRCDFKCDIGYKMSGLKASTCLDDGNGDEFGDWSSPPPTCTSTGCEPPLRAPENGKMTCTDGNSYRSVCTFTCNPGYYMVSAGAINILVNKLNIDCTVQNVWSDREPTCRPIVCPPPRSDPKNGAVDCTNDINYLSECTYTCDPGFQLSTKFPTTVCQDDGNGDGVGVWSRPPPRCDPTNCTPPQKAPANGKVSCTNGNKFGSACTFTCNVGYYMMDADESMVLSGTDRTFCEAGNKWSKGPPRCLPIKCMPPHVDPDNGVVGCSNRNNYLSTCSFKCDPGYDLTGSPSSKCESDGNKDDLGEWSKPPPSCKLGACKPPMTAPKNGKVVCTDGSAVGSDCEFECDIGYYLVEGSKPMKRRTVIATCGKNKLWSRKKPECAPIKCVPPHVAPKNGKMTCSNRNLYASECNFVCNVGFKLNPGPGLLPPAQPDYSICEEDDILGDENGEWSAPPPTCVRDVCNPPREAPENGKVSCTNTNVLGSICTYVCNDGFYMEDSKSTNVKKNRLQTTCGTDLTWDVAPPTCKPIVCRPVQKDPDNGEVRCTNENFYLSVCTFSCDEQYTMSGSLRTKCNDDGNGDPFGKWSEPPPTCQKNFCDPEKPRDPVNGYKVCSDGNNLGSTCEFACDDYHKRVGPLFSRCVEKPNGELEWTNPPPVCEKICCKDDRMKGGFAHGEMSCSNDNCATSVCQFECTREGYSLYPEGFDTNTCRNDSTWDRRKPCCARPCPPNAEMDAIVVLDSSSSVGVPNWAIMKAFVRLIIGSFTVAPDTANFGVFRYNAEVDPSTQILLNEFTSDIEGLLEKYDKIPYNGSGTMTGQALEYVRDVMLKPKNGNRKQVPDLVIVLTDGRSQDRVDKISDELRAMGAFMFVVGIQPPRGALDMAQLLEIAGSPDQLLIAESFAGLNSEFALQLTDKVCGDPCVHRTHFGEKKKNSN